MFSFLQRVQQFALGSIEVSFHCPQWNPHDFGHLFIRFLFKVKERVAAIEKGMELPPWPEGLFRRFEENLHPRRYLRRGLVWLFLGITVSTAVYVAGRGGSKNAIYGLIPAGIGLAYLIYYRIEGKREAEEWQKLQEKTPPMPISGVLR